MRWPSLSQRKFKKFFPIFSLIVGVVTAASLYAYKHNYPKRSIASDSDAFTYERLTQLLQDKKPQSIDELLPLLPLNFRSNYAVIYRSRSTLQEASETFPRILMYGGTDARLLMTFNGSPTQKGYDELELIQYRDLTQTFDLFQVKLPYDPKNPPQKNPSACLTCHGDHPRPNWDTYFLWPGLIGAHDGDMLGKDVDRKAAINWTQGRYQFIKADLAVSEPNSNLSTLLGLLNGQRIAKLIKDDPTLYPFRFAILGATVCSDGRFGIDQFLTAAAQKMMRTPYEQVLADTVLKNRNYYLGKVHQVDLDLMEADGVSVLKGKRAMKPEYQDHGPEYPEQISRLRFIVEGLGGSMDRWNMPFDTGTYSFNDGAVSVLNPEWWMPLFTSSDDADVSADLHANGEKILKYFGDLDSNHPPQPPQEYLDFCTKLSKKSLASLAQLPSQPGTPTPTPTSTVPVVAQLCMSCHVGQNIVAPPIPFDRPQELKTWLSTRLPDGSTKQDLLLSKISNTPLSGSRMPPFRILAPAERSDLLNYLQTVVDSLH